MQTESGRFAATPLPSLIGQNAAIAAGLGVLVLAHSQRRSRGRSVDPSHATVMVTGIGAVIIDRVLQLSGLQIPGTKIRPFSVKLVPESLLDIARRSPPQ